MTETEKLPHFFPVPYEVTEGEVYKWCGCGLSLTQPLCDREGCGEKSVCYKAMLTETVYFCGCKETRDPPFCDGSHARVMLEYLKNRECN